MQKTITIQFDVAGKPVSFDFTVTTAGYNKYLDNMTPSNKVAPSHNFVVSSVDGDEQRKELGALLNETPGLALQLAGELVEEFAPEVNITLKKSSAAPKA